MAVNASYQLPPEIPQPTDFQVQDFIINDTGEANLPFMEDDIIEDNPPIGGGPNVGPGTGEPDPDVDPEDDPGGIDWEAVGIAAEELLLNSDLPIDDWGTTMESFNNYWDTKLSSEDYVLNYLGGYTGFELNDHNNGNTGFSPLFAESVFDQDNHKYGTQQND